MEDKEKKEKDKKSILRHTVPPFGTMGKNLSCSVYVTFLNHDFKHHF